MSDQPNAKAWIDDALAALKFLREEGYTQERIAQEIKVTFSTVNRWDNGHVAPSRLAADALITFAERVRLGQV